MTVLTASGFSYSITPLPDGSLDVRIGPDASHRPGEAMVLHIPLADALCFGVDLASAARWELTDKAVRAAVSEEGS